MSTLWSLKQSGPASNAWHFCLPFDIFVIYLSVKSLRVAHTFTLYYFENTCDTRMWLAAWERLLLLNTTIQTPLFHSGFGMENATIAGIAAFALSVASLAMATEACDKEDERPHRSPQPCFASGNRLPSPCCAHFERLELANCVTLRQNTNLGKWELR